LLDRSALKGFLPLIATPCYGGMVCLNYALGILALQRACAEGVSARVSLAARRQPRHPLPQRLRRRLSGEAQFTHLFFVEADIGFTPEAAFRLLLADRDVARAFIR
jgi:hypothetical protein